MKERLTRQFVARVLLGSATICCACTAPADDPSQTGDSGDAEWQLVEDLRLDANVEDFSVVWGIHVGPEGEIVVLEPQDQRVRIYDSAGTLAVTFGRRGEGPGEFQYIGPVFWVADTLVVWDVELARGTYLLTDGTLVRTEAARSFGPDLGAAGPDSTFVRFIPVAADADGGRIGEALLVVSTGGRSEPGGRPVILGVSRDGQPRVVAKPPNDEHWTFAVAGLGKVVPFVFRPRIEVAADGSRFLLMTTDQSTLNPTYGLTLVRPAHDTVFSRSYAYPGEPIPDSAMNRGIAEMGRESNVARRVRARARELAPAVYPPSDVTLGLDGTIWVELRRTDSGTPVHVLSETGDPIGSLFLPARSRIRQASMTHLWVTERDQFDLASVVRYRVIRGN